MKRFFTVFAFVAGILVLPAPYVHAEEYSAHAAQAVTRVVQSQLNAFADDDAERAYGLATLATQSLAGTPHELLRIIKQRFTPIYRHRHALFSEPEIIGAHALQVVQLTDHDDLVWIAIYEVEREEDGSWKVDGCRLFETNNQSI